MVTANMIINQSRMLSDIVDPDIVGKEADFEYAGVEGSAELIGWKIVFFRKNGSSAVHAISLSDIETEDEITLCNFILRKIGFPLDFHSELRDIYSELGTALSKEKVLADCDTYCFQPSQSCRILIDISDETIKGIQIICDPEIIDNMLN